MRASRIALAMTAACLATACSNLDTDGRAGTSVLVRSTAAMSSAEKLRRLDVMLMVTSLRCRNTRDDFSIDYRRFSQRQIAVLNAAGTELRDALAKRYSARDGQDTLDRLDTSVANAYGAGHPWLSCRDLKQVARNLARIDGRATLVEAADQLVARRRPAHLASVDR